MSHVFWPNYSKPQGNIRVLWNGAQGTDTE